MLSRLAVWYLWKRKKSAIIGFSLGDGELQTKNSTTYYYDNEFGDIVVKDKNGKGFNIPFNAKFKISYKDDDNETV
ncbi:hypothetical protein PQE70_gp075 [Bacillus phage vB_BanS_Nate]|uniref:Uncharacterized protein n=1 Tax=Bacillus phage vB_BanS_Nate TaxID=2894788 RepID=A0AAE8YVX1_9CAUD|nr:hypothetical protein PQE70_gp075 [Bacillus phage vB_BanS_Nate]UGO50928.1 hypothetical protein NATE_75 [Bacillus phage vB_BanS_Nate]